MKRIGQTDDGVLIEMTGADLKCLEVACQAIQQIAGMIPVVGEKAEHAVAIATLPETTNKDHRRPRKVARTGTAKWGSTKPARTTAVEAAPAGGPTYKRVLAVLKQVGPCNTSDLTIACEKAGIDTTTKKLGVMLSTYKDQFKRHPDHTWSAIGAAVSFKAPATYSPPNVTVIPSRIDAIREADRRAKERRGEIDPLERAANVASRIRAEEN
jgi:hypothetical protein